MSRLRQDEIEYSNEVAGDAGNYLWQARFDLSGTGYLGITQRIGAAEGEKLERVLLAPNQVRALMRFVEMWRSR